MKDRLPTDSATLGRRSTPWRALLVGALVAFAASVSAAGCSDEGEGERCTYFANSGDAGVNGTNECSSGLVCQSAGSAFVTPTCGNGTASGACIGTLGVCCPPPGVAATASACIITSSGSTMAGPPASDGSVPGDAGTDGHAADSGPEAGHVDGAADGHLDATSDGTVTSEAGDASNDGATEATDGASDAPKDATGG